MVWMLALKIILDYIDQSEIERDIEIIKFVSNILTKMNQTNEMS